MDQFQDPYVRALGMRNRGSPLQSSAPLWCPACGGEAEFADRDELLAHFASAHPDADLHSLEQIPAKPPLGQPRNVKDLLGNRGSPVRSESRNSESAMRTSSIKAAYGSREASRSPSSDGDGINKPGSRGKRPFAGDSTSEHLAKHHAREHAARPPFQPSPVSGALRLPTIQPEDVDPTFKRTPADQPRASDDPTVRQTPVSPNKEGIGTVRPPSSHVSKGLPAATAQAPTAHSQNTYIKSATSSVSPPPSRPGSSGGRPAGALNLRYKPEWPTLALQPQSRPVFQEHLAAEVKSIYTGLTQVETKCVHIDRVQQATPRNESRITDDHWQAMIALHRTLLHEHHDFFLASQHPAASPALKRLAIKYSMPARMWKHGIHSFLELLRHRLPESLEYMLAFIYLAYQMIALLYETVPTFRNTWIECLGDLGRYRMAVEDENVRDREIWAGVARSWYNRAADTNPAIGRLFHHLAILARPNMVQQLYLYNRSLTSVMPFLNARESIVTIFEPVLAQSAAPQISKIDFSLVKIHALLFKKERFGLVQELLDSLCSDLPSHIERTGDRWLHTGAYIAIANFGALFDYGIEKNPVRFLFDYRRKEIQQQDPKTLPPGLPEDQSVPNPFSIPALDAESEEAFHCSVRLVFSVFRVVLSRKSDKAILPYVHVVLVFLLHLCEISAAAFGNTTTVIFQAVIMNDLVSLLNTLLVTESNIDMAFQQRIVFENMGRPLPEDWMLRGLSWSFNYCPRTWFKNAAVIEEEERYMELTSTMKARVDRVLSLAARLAEKGRWIKFDAEKNQFSLINDKSDAPEEDEGYNSGEDSALMKKLKKHHKHAQSAEPCSPLRDMDTISREYDSLIVDAGVLLNKSEVFERLLDVGLQIVIPREAADELLQAHANDEPTGALNGLSNAMRRGCDIRIKTSSGEDVTESYRASLQETFPAAQSRAGLSSKFEAPLKSRVSPLRSNNDDLFGLLRRESNLSSKPTRTNTVMSMSIFSQSTSGDTEMTEPDEEEYEVAGRAAGDQEGLKKSLLVTDDRKLRIQVSNSFGTAAIATYMLKKWLSHTRRSIGELERPDQTAMEIDAPNEIAAAP